MKLMLITVLIAIGGLHVRCFATPDRTLIPYQKTALLPDSVKAYIDTVVKEQANIFKCRVVVKTTNNNGISFYSGYDGRTNTAITDFSGTIDIGSCTKMFTATAILQLVEQGRLSLSDKLTKLIPNPTLYSKLAVIDGIDYIDSVTVGQLLNHTSGLPDYFAGDDNVEFTIHGDSTLRFTDDQLIRLAKRLNKPSGKPGQLFHYSNTNYILLGRILQQTTSKNFKLYFRQHILNPLDLKSTWFSSDYNAANRSPGHWQGGPSEMPANMAGPAGEIVSTLDDMTKFISAWHNGLLFRKKSTGDLVKQQFFNAMGGGLQYGLGVINMNNQTFGHAGQTFGFQAYMGAANNGYVFAIGADDGNAAVWPLAMAMSKALYQLQ